MQERNKKRESEMIKNPQKRNKIESEEDRAHQTPKRGKDNDKE